MTHAEAIDKFLNAIETAAIPACDVWSADATLDATVPNWRFHVSGADAIRTEYGPRGMTPGWSETSRSWSSTGTGPATTPGAECRRGPRRPGRKS